MTARVLTWVLLFAAPLLLTVPSGLDGSCGDFCQGDCLCSFCIFASVHPSSELLPHWQAMANEEVIPDNRCLPPANGALDDVYRPPRFA